ncbi:hypothetical protein Ndes2437A_g04905 [Nannochloris sp. 'desiccata']|nr:hypothetical protein KSW81_002947 [Chlorella desiccata (nom. nud.)]
MITYEEFASAASKLQTLALEWKWIDSTNTHLPSSLGQGYLERISIRQAGNGVPCSCLEKEETEEDDLSGSTPPAPLALISWRIHVCYSHSYREPVLYFQTTEQSGTPLPFNRILKELENDEPKFSNKQTNNNTGGLDIQKLDLLSISQEDHPVLHTPFYMLHPCKTGEIMASLASENKEMQQNSSTPPRLPASQPAEQGSFNLCNSKLKYLLAWLCVAGRPLGVAPNTLEYVAMLNSGA